MEHMLTDKEKELFLDIADDEYSNGEEEDSCPWSWSVVGGSKSRAGVLSSLVKKGFVGCEGEGRDASCWYTDAGKVLFRQLRSET